ncbi:hypothetical protein JCM13664_10590 [Methylothermus subterraneus]
MRTPCGILELKAQGEILTDLSWRTGTEQEEDGELAAVKAQLKAYFRDPATPFECVLAAKGSAFCRRVWQALLAIPPGEARTYGELARQLGTYPRAVAAACRANPYPILVPCHRVVAKSGLGGYCGRSLGEAVEIKRWLLRHEGWMSR